MASRLDSICLALQFIEVHLRTQITIADIAEHCGYSIYHFIRLFNQIASQTPYDYLIRRRLSEALKDLRDTSRTITDLAYDYCFGSPESFSRAFKRVFGHLPSSYRTDQLLTGCLPIPPRTRRDLEFFYQAGFMPPQLVSIDEITIAGLPISVISPGQLDVTAQIDLLQKVILPNGVDNKDRFFSVISYNDEPFSPHYNFFGAVVDVRAYPPPVSIQRIPSGCYVRLRYDQPDHQLALRYLFYTWLPDARMTLGLRFFVEEILYDREQSVQSTILVPVSSKVPWSGFSH